MTLDDGGTGLCELGEGMVTCPARGFCSPRTFNRLRYIQKNITAPNVLTNSQLVMPAPRNTLTVQVSKGKQIAVLEEETHKECRRCRIRPC